MKKVFFSFFIVSVCSCTLFANEMFKAKDFIPYSVAVGTGNDTFTLGSGINQDDQLTFSLGAMVEAPLWIFSLDALSITNKGWITDGKVTKGRYDVYSGCFRLNLNIVNNEKLFFIITPIVGFSFYGNGGLDKLQNDLHSSIGLHGYSIPYEENVYSPEISALFSFGTKKTIKNKTFGFSLNFATINNILFQYEQDVFINGFLELDKKKVLSLSLGYSFIEEHSGKNTTQNLYLWYTNGLYLKADANFGILKIQHKSMLTSTFSYTTLYIDFFEMFSFKPVWKKSNFFFDVGVWTFSNFTKKSFKISYLIPDLPLRVYFEDHFGSGLSFIDNIERDNAFFSIGLQYDIPDEWSLKIFSPFVFLGLGLARWQTVEGLKTPKDNGDNFNINSVYNFFVDVGVGCNLIPPGIIVTTNFTYRITAIVSCRIFLDKDRVNKFLETTCTNNNEDALFHKINTLEMRYTLGIEIGF